MTKSRLEAFSDGVFAIIITITVLEIKVPHGTAWADLRPLIPVFASYALSFVYVGIYWNNHHHMFSAVQNIDGSVLWANSFLLFWLSLLPFCAAWVGEHGLSTAPVALYCMVFLMAGVGYFILSKRLLRLHAPDSVLAKALSSGVKEKVSTLANLLAIGLAFLDTRFSIALLVLVAAMWIVPDRRIERKLMNEVYEE